MSKYSSMIGFIVPCGDDGDIPNPWWICDVTILVLDKESGELREVNMWMATEDAYTIKPSHPNGHPFQADGWLFVTGLSDDEAQQARDALLAGINEAATHISNKYKEWDTLHGGTRFPGKLADAL